MIQNEEERDEVIEENTQESVDKFAEEKKALEEKLAKAEAELAALKASNKDLEDQARTKAKKHAEEAAMGEPNQSGEKSKFLTGMFIYKNVGNDGAKGDNVGSKTTEELKKLEDPVQKNFDDARNERKTNPISPEAIVYGPEHKRLSLIFRCGLHTRDVGNGMRGEQDGSNREKLKNNIEKAAPQNNKVCLIYAGDWSGSEWKMRYLRNAKIVVKKPATETTPAVETIIYSGVKDRKNSFKTSEIRPLLRSYPNIEIYVMNGAQEAEINKYFKCNIAKEIVEELNDPRVHYIPGVNTIVPIERKCKNGESFVATMGILTNNGNSKAVKGQTVLRAIMQNSGDNAADVKFATNTNVGGKLIEGLYAVRGEGELKSTPVGKRPEEKLSEDNVFCLNVEGPHTVSVIQGVNFPEMTPQDKVEHETRVISAYIKVLKEELLHRDERQNDRRYKVTPEDRQFVHNEMKKVKAANKALKAGGKDGNDMSKV